VTVAVDSPEYPQAYNPGPQEGAFNAGVVSDCLFFNEHPERTHSARRMDVPELAGLVAGHAIKPPRYAIAVCRRDGTIINRRVFVLDARTDREMGHGHIDEEHARAIFEAPVATWWDHFNMELVLGAYFVARLLAAPVGGHA